MKLKMDLAGLKHRPKDYEGAAALMEEAIPNYEQTLGPDHPSTRSNVGLLYSHQGRQSEAEAVFREVLAIRLPIPARTHSARHRPSRRSRA